HGPQLLTLEAIGTQQGVTRERIRQILSKSERRIYSNYIGIARTSVRLQSALLLAADMGKSITYDKWINAIRDSGLLGVWRQGSRSESPATVLQIVFSVLLGRQDSEFSLPSNLRTVFDAALNGRPYVPAALVERLETSARDLSRHIKRHARFTGAVS